MGRRYDNYGGKREKKRGSHIFWVFMGIIVFAAIFYPFFGGDLRYEIGFVVSDFLKSAGLLLVSLGNMTVFAFCCMGAGRDGSGGDGVPSWGDYLKIAMGFGLIFLGVFCLYCGSVIGGLPDIF